MLCLNTSVKSIILNVKGHTGHSSFTKCIDRGKYFRSSHKSWFSDKLHKLRIGEDFLK